MKPLLVVWETHHLGDALLSLPFIRAARKNREVWIVCRRNQAPLYRLYDPTLKILEWEPFWSEELGWGGRLASLLRLPVLLGKLRNPGAHEAVSCWADVRVHFLMILSGAKRRVGLPMAVDNFYAAHLPWRKKKLEKAVKVERILETILKKKLLSDPFYRKAEAPSHLDVWSLLAKAWEWEPDCNTPWLSSPELRPCSIAGFLRKAREEGRQIWMVHPGARHPARRWPLESFRQVVDKTLSGHLHAVIYIEGEERISLTGLPDWQKSFKLGSLEDFVASVGSVDTLFCNDSFPAHLGAALGKKVWTLFSNQDPALFAPFQNEGRVIAKNVCEFRPCLDRCLKPSFECLEALTVEEVEKALKEPR